CHVVMCRNVLIYLDRRHAESFLDRLADAMDPSAYLFVGGAETLWQITDRFEPTPLGTCYAYRPRPRPHARAAPGARAATARQTVVGTVPARSVSSPRTPRPATHLPHLEVARSMETDPDATGGDRQRRGQELLAAGAVAEAIVVLRQWSYECPDDPLAHFQMGVALDRHGDGPSARRAYRAALGALDRLVPGRRVELLEGFSEAALRDLLNDRSGVDGRRRPVGGSP
ncbi:MAG: CheR family methyltransferase, partial [Ilumatobacteraceae bacterium]